MNSLFLNDHRLSLAIIILIFSTNSIINAQSSPLGTLEGIVLDGSSDLPLENAIVKLVELNKFDATDKNGIFEFKSIPFGNYNIEISFLGYKTLFTSISIYDEINKLICISRLTVAVVPKKESFIRPGL